MAKTEVAYTAYFDRYCQTLGSGGSLLASVDANGRPNAMTIGWALLGVVWRRPICAVFVRPSRYTYGCIEATGDFTVNVPPPELAEQVLFCGTESGRDRDKFEQSGWTPLPASQVNAPIIKECPLALECRTRQKLSLGSHDLYIGEVLAVQAHEELLDANGALKIDAVEPLAYCPNCKGLGQYWSLHEVLGHHGVSREQHKRI